MEASLGRGERGEERQEGKADVVEQAMMLEGRSVQASTYIVQQYCNTKNVTVRSRRPKGKEGGQLPHDYLLNSSPLKPWALSVPQNVNLRTDPRGKGQGEQLVPRREAYCTVPTTAAPSRQKVLPPSVSVRRLVPPVADVYYRESGGGAEEHNRAFRDRQ